MPIPTGHYYKPDGTPAHFVECKTREGTRPTTIADARKLGLYPSVTQILKCMDKPALTTWLINNAVDAVLTTPRLAGESLDDFKARALSKDAKEESERAKDLGTDIHAAIDEHLAGRLYAPQFKPYVEAAMVQVNMLGRVTASEMVLVHPSGYAGKMDAQCEGNCVTVLDFKTTKKLPTKAAWPEHVLQTSAYAACLGNTGDKQIQTALLYISTVEPGQVALFIQPEWQESWKVFRAVFQVWKFLNNYNPIQP